MPVGVINFLEIVEIEIDHAYLRVATFSDGVADHLMDSVAVGQAGDGVGVGQHAQALLRAALFGDIGAGADQENFVSPAAAVHKLIAKQKQPLAFAGFDPALDLIGTAVAKKTGDITPRRGRFSRRHKQLKDILPDHFVFFQAGVFFAQPVEALNIAVAIEDDNHRVGFRNHLLREGESLHEIARHRRRVVPRRRRARPLFTGDFTTYQMHRHRFAKQR